MKNWFSFSRITIFFISIYLIFTLKSFYDIFYPSSCPESIPQSRECIYQLRNWQKNYKFSVCISKNRPKQYSDCNQMITLSEDLNQSFNKEILLELPEKTTNNGSLIVYFIFNRDDDVRFQFSVIKEFKLSKYKLNSTNSYINLLENVNENTNKKNEKPITHLIKRVKIYTLNDKINFYRNEIPIELFNDLKLDKNDNYLPYLHIDKLLIKDEDYKVLNKSQSNINFTIEYVPINTGHLRFHRQLENSLNSMKELGFTEDQLNELFIMFSEIDFKILFLTFFVSVIHLLFEMLSFKNDISFWKNCNSVVGISVKTMIWRFISQIIIFAYLFIEETSYLILVPSGISVIIELWKLFKALKVKIVFENSLIPRFKILEMSSSEKQTSDYDSIVMKKLSYLLYPLCIGFAIYSLVYNKHKNWYQWLINSLVNGIYAFGFLFMMPQLFINYKLKSVAHLPWKSFMYKAFNTFIDDVFAFIIKMPTSHRIACLRDDVVFIIYLYQRWLYPIDKNRVNEFGESFNETKQTEEKPKVE